jgi:Tol biopolymer transport system component
MSEVHLAEDLKLGRQVALKFLAFPSDAVAPQILDRFRREARAAAALSHPNICTIYGTEQCGGQPVIVMEFVEGETLASRLARGALPLAHTTETAAQIAGALAEAHRKGIIHRDLKPANIMLTKFGAKVLDFGLAKIERQVTASDETAAVESVILGTPHYMSPEQARGNEVDARSDIFSFGVVLYEMLTGKRPFDGDDPAGVMASILEREPPDLADGVATPVLTRVLLRCLVKDREDRWQSARDLKAELEWIADAAPVRAAKGRRSGIAAGWIAAGLLGATLGLVSGFLNNKEPTGMATLRSTIVPPEKSKYAALSPDGRHVVFQTSTGANGRLWLRAMDSIAAQPLTGTEGAALGEFWSPDSRFVAFFSYDNKLKKIDIDGGPPITICDVGSPRGGSWGRQGEIVFAPFYLGPLYRVPASGGVSTPVTSLDETRKEVSHSDPWFLPDGQHFLFTAADTGLATGQVTIRLGSLSSPGSKILLEANSNAIYAQGHLLFLRHGVLMAQAFDVSRLSITGDPVSLAEHVQSGLNSAFGAFHVSENGLLLYRQGTGPEALQLEWFDRGGQRVSALADPGAFSNINLSPDRTKVAVALTQDSNTDIWLYDIARGSRTRFTFDPAVEAEAVWSPDGRTIVFSSNRKGSYDLYRRAADGSGAEELLYSDNLNKHPTSWSPDGRYLLYTAEGNPKTGNDIWVLPLTAAQPSGALTPFPFLQGPFSEDHGQFSPDGRWVAYQSRETGGYQIYVTAFQPQSLPMSGMVGKWQVSSGEAGTTQPRWRSDGKEILYVARYGILRVADVRERGASLELSETRALFAPLVHVRGYLYDLSIDGQRILTALPPDQNASEPFTLVQNWNAALKK